MADDKKDQKTADRYTAGTIEVLEGLDPVKKRPGMYIGSTGKEGLHHMIWEVVDNSIDEAMANFADTIEVIIHEDNSVTVTDNGRGIPIEDHPATGKPALETVMTTLHAGGKFGGEGYQVSGGLHGVGVSVVNALSDWMEVEVIRDGTKYKQKYEEGETVTEIEEVGESDGNGTKTTWMPNDEIFEDVNDYDLDFIFDHLRQQAYLTKGTKIRVVDESSNRIKNFYFEGGIKSYVRFLNKGKDRLFRPPFYVEKEYIDDDLEGEILVEIAMQYTKDIQEKVLPFANNITNPDGGSHLTGFRAALTRTLNDYAHENNYLKESERLAGQDVREGLTAVISVKLTEPQFEGQTKTKLGNPEVRGAVQSVLGDHLEAFLEENPTEASKIINKGITAAKARKAAKAARETVMRKGVLSGLNLPGKLTDCISKKPEESELYIVEGDSAGGNAKQGRDSQFQAILPLRGKILNVERARLDRMLENKEIKSLVIALGAGIGEEFDIDDIRYHRIVIMTDADVDGAHIRTLLLTFFFRYMPEVIKRDYLYIARPPLYRIRYRGKTEYAYTEDERTEMVEEIREESNVNPDIQRYKGLGEMNPEQLWETTMNPENRILKKVEIEDAEEADRIFHTLMGKDVGPRKKFIQTHATAVENLDI